jgi:hypothetical protein
MTGKGRDVGRCHLLAVPVRFRIALARILFSQHVFVQLDSNGLAGTGESVLCRAKPHQAGRLLRRAVLPWWERICQRPVPLEWVEYDHLLSSRRYST